MAAASALSELLQSLMSKEGEEKMTNVESEFFINLKNKVLRSSVIGGTVATGLVYVATRKLNTFNRISLAGGAGMFTGYWRLKESMYSCADYVLELDGSRMQRELRKIMLRRYGDNPQIMQRFSKHFYCEDVFNDLNAERPRSVYRQRNSFMDDQQIANGNVYGVSETDEEDQNHHKNNEAKSLKVGGPSMNNKQVRVNPGISGSGYGDPLEVLFGSSLANEENQQPDESNDTTKVKGRAQKKARRKQRMHRYRESSSLGEAQLLSR